MYIVDDYLKNAGLRRKIRDSYRKLSCDSSCSEKEREHLQCLAEREERLAKRDIRDAAVVLACLIGTPILIGTAFFIERCSK